MSDATLYMRGLFMQEEVEAHTKPRAGPALTHIADSVDGTGKHSR